MINDDGALDATPAQAARGYRSTLVSQAIRVVCKAAAVVVLARLVTPADHGLFAMAASVFFVFVLFRDAGLGPAAIRARELTEEQRSALWRAHVLIGIVLAGLVALIAPLAAAFYREPRVAWLLYWMSGALVLIGLNAWPRILLTRELRFHALNTVETIAAIVGTAAMIVAGAKGAGAFAFVSFLLVSEGALTIGAWMICRWRPCAPPRWASLRGFWREGADLTGNNVVTAVLQQLDALLMGRWFGAFALGLYNRPGQLLALPTLHIAAPATHVLLATLARLGPASTEFASHVRGAANLIAHLTLPLAVVCAVLPDEVVHLVLGAAWPQAAPLLRWLSVGAAAMYLGATTYAVCIATGHTRRLAAQSVVALGVTLVALWLGRAGGPEGLAAAVALANVCLLPLRLAWSVRGTPVRLSDYAAAFVRPVAVAGVFAAGMAIGRRAAGDADWPFRLAAGMGGGALSAGVAVLGWPRLRHELFGLWRPHRSVAAT
jgi:O-antigen/teichoic acid export membrane protein